MIVDWAKYGNIYVVSLVPLLAGLAALAVVLSKTDMSLVPPARPALVLRLGAALAIGIGSLGGAVQVWRREAPGPLGGSIEGGCAVVLGWIWIIIFGAAALASLFLL